MGPILVVMWLVVVLPCAIFAAGFLASSALEVLMRRLAGTVTASESHN